MSQLQTNLNIRPYYDDYDESKQYYRILFVPSRSVQVRELIQTQTIAQEQIRRFGDHIFKDGSIVSGCNITKIPNLQYVRVENDFNANTANNVFDDNLQNCLLVSSSGVRASVRLVKSGYALQYPKTNTLYIDYLISGRDNSNNQVVEFSSGETLTIYANNQNKFANTLDSNKIYNTINVFTANVAANQQSTGNTYGLTVGEGVVYQKGVFVNVLSHTITVKDYDTDVDGYLVGFNTEESIVTYLMDPSLIDPLDTTNQNAPGADRLKLVPQLISIHKNNLTDDHNFFPIIEFNATQPILQNVDPEYAKLGDVLAKQKWEESGDFVIKPFTVTTADNANSALFDYQISGGIGYVKGNRVELLATKTLTTNRATTEQSSNANIITINYGNYVYVSQLVGMFDTDNYGTVSIYDQPQHSITDKEGSTTAPSGSVIGTANIRAVMYNSGTKGVSNCVYRIYLTNIVINSGKSFANDAKSLVISGGTFGSAKADIVLDGGKAVIHDSAKSGLIFDTGLAGVKRFRDSNGDNDSSFYFRDVVSSTLQSNGSVTFTLNSAHSGGYERFFASVGTLSDASELRIDVALSNNMYTANLTGTVNANTNGSNTLTGVSTAFTTDYSVGSLIRIQNGSNTAIRIVKAIANNTSMTIDSPIAEANLTAVHQQYFLAGQILNLANATVTAISNSQFTVDYNKTFDFGAPQTVYASYPVVRSQAVQASKVVHRDRFVKIDCSTSSVVGPWNLGTCDIYKLQAVYVGTTFSETNPDRIDWFSLDNGQTITHYDHGKLVIDPKYKSNINSSTRILVKFSAFGVSDATGAGFFTVDSYPTRAPGAAANSTNISYADIPTISGYDLRNCIDFRPRKIDTATDSPSANLASINPDPSNSTFVSTSSGIYLAEPDSNFEADIEYYLPRFDLIQVNKDGQFNVKTGVPSISAVTPTADQDSMEVSIVRVPPYPSLTVEQSINYLTPDKITVRRATNRGYTMKDINALDQRITRLEWQATLSLLEQQARDYTVKDENGLDRFKSGIFADPFNNHALGDVSNYEYTIAIDEQQSVARPRINKNPVDLKVLTKTNTVVNGSTLSLPYNPTLLCSQPYASKYRNATESVWNWTGNVSLYPSYDHFRDEQGQPDVNVTVDVASAWEDFANSPFASSFGDWRVSNTSSVVVSANGAITTTRTSTQTRDINQLKVDSISSTQDLGSFVTDVTLNPFIRSREVAIIATGLKPNSKFYVFFDRQNVSQYCAPAQLATGFDPNTGTIQTEGGNPSSIVTRTNSYGTQLVSDSSGNLYAVFNIPAQTFRVGDRELIVANVDDLTTGEDAITSSAHSFYTASSLTITSKDVSITTVTPRLSTIANTQVRVTSTVDVSRPVAPTPTSTDPFNNINGSNGGQGESDDPLGQSFLVTTPYDVPGIFLNKIGVYFKSKDPTLGVTCFISEMSAGVPDTSRIVASSYLKPSQVSVSNDASAETLFTFADIPYLENGKYYCFFIAPDGNSPEYLIYMSEIGGTDILTGQKIFSNPSVGVAFTSSNSNSWTALQTEDIKFNIYRCQFTQNSGSAVMCDQDDEYLTINGFTLANSGYSVQVGDVVYSQNSSGVVQTSNSSPFGVIQFVDQAADRLIIDSSQGTFTANTVLQIHRPALVGNVAAISPASLIANTTIVSVDDYDYSIVVPRFGIKTAFSTSVSTEFKGIDGNESVDGNWIKVSNDVETELFDKLRVIKSKSNRSVVTNSAQFKLNLTSPTDYLSPIIDIRRKSGLFIENIINNDLTDEQTRQGNALARQVSQIIVLEEGQDAEDIKVLITGHRPAQTDVSCYVKFWNGSDPQQFYDKLWTKLEMTEGETVYCNVLDRNDFREYGFTVPTSEVSQGQVYLNQNNGGIIEYRDQSGSIYVGYKKFAIKLVLTAVSSEKIPLVRDVRALALQI